MHELILIFGGFLGIVLGTIQASLHEKRGDAGLVVKWYGVVGVSVMACALGVLWPVATWLYRAGH